MKSAKVIHYDTRTTEQELPDGQDLHSRAIQVIYTNNIEASGTSTGAIPLDDTNTNITDYYDRYKSMLMTPMEYYSSISTGQISSDGIYDRDVDVVKPETYFWVNTLRNWACYKIFDEQVDAEYFNANKIVEAKSYKATVYHLYVWNGINGWTDLAKEFVTSQHGVTESDRFKNSQKLLYDTARFKYISNFKITCNDYSSSQGTCEYNGNTNEFQAFNLNGVASTLTLNNSSTYAGSYTISIARGIVLTEDWKYSVLETNSCQALRNKSIYGANYSNLLPQNIDMNYPYYFTGCPFVWRLPSGELFLSLEWRLDGSVIGNNNAHVSPCSDVSTFANSVLLAFFSQGTNKTMQNWKNFTDDIDSSEEVATTDANLTDASDETLVASCVPQETAQVTTTNKDVVMTPNSSKISSDVDIATINTIVKW